ncbi:dockerin type I repeat-containing protein [Ruminococcus sp.]
MGHVDELPIIYASSTSEFAKEFAKLPDNIRVSAPNIVYSDETAYVGDVNLDGEVNLKDAVLLNKCVNGSVTYNELQKVNMDCNGDGVISADDSLTLLKFLIQLINQL